MFASNRRWTTVIVSMTMGMPLAARADDWSTAERGPFPPFKIQLRNTHTDESDPASGAPNA